VEILQPFDDVDGFLLACKLVNVKVSPTFIRKGPYQQSSENDVIDSETDGSFVLSELIDTIVTLGPVT
jgi:hypothetical protein